MPRLAGKTALITGAAIARAFITEGARHVRITDIDDVAGRETASSLGAAARYDHLDVRDEAGWRRVTTALLDEFGALDIVVNHAGITGFEAAPRPHDPEHASLVDWRAVHDTNLDGVFLSCRAAIRAMRPARRRDHQYRLPLRHGRRHPAVAFTGNHENSDRETTPASFGRTPRLVSGHSSRCLYSAI